MRGVQVVGLYLADATLSRCTTTTERLKKLYTRVNDGDDAAAASDAGAGDAEARGAGGEAGAAPVAEDSDRAAEGPSARRFEVVYVSQDSSSDAMAAAMADAPWVALPWHDDHENKIR